MKPSPRRAAQALCQSASFASALSLCACTAGAPAPDEEAFGSSTLPRTTCVGDGDGAITIGEWPSEPVFGASAWFHLQTGDVPVAPLDGDQRALGALDGDLPLPLGPLRPDDHWWVGYFPSATYAATLDVEAGIDGVFTQGDGGEVLLLGLVSAEEEVTRLRYLEPVLFMPFPLEPGAEWQQEVDAIGLVDGVTYPTNLGQDGVVSLRHRYTFDVPALETLSVPAFDTRALRVRTAVRVEAWNSLAGLFATDTERVQGWFVECLGLVARARSFEDEVDPDFATARESIRLGALWHAAR